MMAYLIFVTNGNHENYKYRSDPQTLDDKCLVKDTNLCID